MEEYTSIFCVNLRFLLWKQGLRSERWAEALSSQLHWSPSLARLVLSGQKPTPSQIQEVALLFSRAEEEMALEDLVEFEGVEVLLENLRFLARDMAHGGKKELALKLGVDPNTVSRWFSGRHHPPAEKLRDIADCFSLKSDVDLASSRLFLSLEPISALQRRHWLHNRVDALCDEDLSALFPALRKLFD